jgi:hypothetical protein
MKNLLLSILLLFALAAAAAAQPITTDKGKRSDEIYIKIRKIDLLSQLLPLVLTKEQINNTLLPSIEKARQRIRLVLSAEDDEVGSLEDRVNEVLKNALERGVFPPPTFTDEIERRSRGMATRRSVEIANQTEEILKAVKPVMTAGQWKVMAGTFPARVADPTATDPEKVSEDLRVRVFIQRVLLDPLTRELLMDIAEKRKDAPAGDGGGR